MGCSVELVGIGSDSTPRSAGLRPLSTGSRKVGLLFGIPPRFEGAPEMV